MQIEVAVLAPRFYPKSLSDSVDLKQHERRRTSVATVTTLQ